MLKRQGLWTFVRSLWRILAGRPAPPASLAHHELLQVICNRRSVRSFARRPLPDDVFAAILEAGRLAPSTVNLQTWTFITYTPDSWRDTFGAELPFGGQRAVLILGDTHRDRLVLDVFPSSPLVEYTVAVMNASLAAMNMNLAAEALGVSSVMLSETGRGGFLDAGFLVERLGLPDRVVPLMTIVFGYERGMRPPMPPRLPMAAVCGEGRYPGVAPGTMEGWLDQMIAGYKAGHLQSSFEAQLRLYQGKIGGAEADLRRLVLGKDGRQARSEVRSHVSPGA